MHGNDTQIDKCMMDIYKLLKEDKEKAIEKMNIEESILNEVLKELDIHQ